MSTNNSAQSGEHIVDETVLEDRKQTLVSYVLDDLPEHVHPVFIDCQGKCYPRKAIADQVIECFEELMQQVISTSKTPEGVLKRIATFRAHPNTKIMVWTEAFKRVFKTINPRTEAELKKETKGNYHLVRLEELI